MAIVKGSTYFNIVFSKILPFTQQFFFMWLQQHLNRTSLNRRFRKSFATGFLAGQQPVIADALIQGLEANLRPGRAMSRVGLGAHDKIDKGWELEGRAMIF